MIRAVLEVLLPFLLPVIVFVTWVLVTHRRAGQGRSVAERLRDGPWLWVMLASAALLIAAVSYAVMTSGAPAGAKYRAPHEENGKIVPGTFE